MPVSGQRSSVPEGTVLGVHPLDAHFVAAMSILAAHSPKTSVVEAYDGITVVAVGAGGSAFNSAWVTGVPVNPMGATARALEVLRETGRPFGFLVPAPLCANVAEPIEAGGLTHVANMPGMMRSATTNLPPLPAGLRVEPVRDILALERHRTATAVGFGAPGPHAMDDVMPPTLLADDRVALFNGYVDGADEPAATAVCVIGQGLAGIYAVTTHEPVRGRGIGAAMTWAAVGAGALAGAAVVVLQASALGEPVYRRMGFETVRDYHRYDQNGQND